MKFCGDTPTTTNVSKDVGGGGIRGVAKATPSKQLKVSSEF